jgi:hypothetical protein
MLNSDQPLLPKSGPRVAAYRRNRGRVIKTCVRSITIHDDYVSSINCRRSDETDDGQAKYKRKESGVKSLTYYVLHARLVQPVEL